MDRYCIVSMYTGTLFIYVFHFNLHHSYTHTEVVHGNRNIELNLNVSTLVISLAINNFINNFIALSLLNRSQKKI